MTTYNLSILTPDGRVFENEVASLQAPGLNGSFGVLANHAPMIAATLPGVFNVKDESGERFFAVGTGMLEVNAGNVIFLADHAEAADNLDAAKDKVRELV